MLRPRDALQHIRTARRQRLRRVSLFRVQQELTFEWEPQADLLVYGEGRTSAAYTGIFKAPNVERKKPDGDAALNDNAL
jgi:hypothetical protein